MRNHVTLAAALAAGSTAACTPAPAASPGEEVGAASEPQTVTYCVLDAHTDVGTVHFQGPDWLLTSSEAAGPLELDVVVQQYVQPAMSTSADIKLDPTAVSAAVGYSLAERYEIQGAGRQALSDGELERLEAYTAFQRTIWEIRDATCAVHLGTGASFKPIGVYFRVVDTTDVTLPELGGYVTAPGGAPPGGP
jgi:hypothetical protein